MKDLLMMKGVRRSVLDALFPKDKVRHSNGISKEDETQRIKAETEAPPAKRFLKTSKITVNIDGIQKSAIPDTGSEINLISQNETRWFPTPMTRTGYEKAFGAGGIDFLSLDSSRTS
jgi:hypothetical protein